MVAVSVNSRALFGAVIVMEMVAVLPGSRYGLIHSTTPFSSLQAHSGPDAETNPVFSGKVLVMMRFDAELGPLFSMESIYVTTSPAATGSGESVTVIDRSDTASTRVFWVWLLFVLSGSYTWEITRAVLEIEPVAVPASTVPLISTSFTSWYPNAPIFRVPGQVLQVPPLSVEYEAC